MLKNRLRDIANTQQWFDALIYGRAYDLLLPELFNFIFIEKSRCQIGLRNKINNNHPFSQHRKHPCQVINQGSLADTSLVVKKSQHRRAHNFPRNTQTTALWLVSNSGAGLPFDSMARRAVAIPRPKAWTNPKVFSTSAMFGLR